MMRSYSAFLPRTYRRPSSNHTPTRLSRSLHDVNGRSVECECPDLFKLPVDGDPEKEKWILTCGGVSYLIGELALNESGGISTATCVVDGEGVTDARFSFDVLINLNIS